MKRIISLILMACMLFTAIPSFAALDNSGNLTWEERADIDNIKSTEREWLFRPFEDAKSEQNPPCFSWPYVGGATAYDLVIARDAEFSDIAYEKYGLSSNYYNFPCLFETGVIYYWTVRYHTSFGTSEWREPSRFLVLPEAYEFPVPPMEETVEKLKSWNHPKNIFNEKNIDEFRGYKDKYESAQKIYDSVLASAATYLNAGIATESDRSTKGGPSLYPTAFAYIIGGDKSCGEYAKKQLLEMATWDPTVTVRYSASDTDFRIALLNMAVAFDWCYDLFTEEEKKVIISAIRERLIIYEDPQDGLQDKVSVANQSPNLSHGVNGLINFFLPTCFIMVNEIPEAEEFIKQYLPLYINLAPIHSNEDGNWGVGVRYWSYVTDNIFCYTLKELTDINIYDKAWYKNEHLMILYLLSSSWVCEFGEGGNGSMVDGNHDAAIRQALGMTELPVLKWKLNELGQSPIASSQYYIFNSIIEQVEASEPPLSYPRSHVFKDTGVAALHSDLVNEGDKISLYFRSSDYGSFGHSHPDQNSFHIHAYGERLAIDSGYYDSFFSTFDLGYTKKSYAHNTVTYSGGQGQPYQACNADGEIVNFLNHPDFDLVTGEAADAYNHGNNGKGYTENLEKFERHIIYLRPDTYIVIDDLKAGNDEKVQFEWWLNAVEDLSLYESRTGAQVIQGNVALDTKIQYPGVTGYYSDIYSGPDLIPYYPSKGNPAITKRVWFETEKTNATKIVATMGVRQKNDTPTYVKNEDKDGNLLLTFEDGTKAYISINGNPVEDKNIKTDADALIIKGDSIMMVDGTYLELDGEKTISSDKKVSVTMGKREIGISASEDCEISLLTGDVNSLKSAKGVPEEEKQFTRGFYWECNDGITSVKAYPGFYSYYINDKPLPGGSAENSTLTYYIDDVEYKTELTGYKNHDEVNVLSGKITNSSGFYTIEDIKDVKLKGGAKGDRLLMNKDENIVVSGDSPVLKLKSASSVKYEAVKIDDPDTFKNELNAFEEAENFKSKSGDAKIYTTRSFLSGGAGISTFNNFGDSMTWEINVPEAGNYDVVIKYVSWSAVVPGVAERLIEVNGELGLAQIAETENYGSAPEEWVASRIKTNATLKKGKNIITVYPISGLWNIDWIGLIKSDK